ERARLAEGSLRWLGAGRGAWHAEAVGVDEGEEGHGDIEFRSVLFWVNLARKDKDVEPSAQVVHSDQIPTRQQGDAAVRVLVGEGSPVQLGTPGLILDIELPEGGAVDTGAARVPWLCLHAGGRGRLRGERAAGQTSPTGAY